MNNQDRINKLENRLIYMLAALLIILTSSLVFGSDRVIDGDTLIYRGVKIRLSNIDAPELHQTCKDAIGESYNCGEYAKRALEDAINGENVSCTIEGIDRYGRMLSVCYEDSININAMLVYLGQAVAYRKYSEEYIPEEEAAKEKKRGVWQGKFEMPWDYRNNRRNQ